MKKTKLLKLAVITSTMLLLASCSFSKEHVHTIKKVDAKTVTCTTEGNIEYYRCAVCGATFSDEKGQNPLEDVTIPVGSSAHSLKHFEAVAATLDNEGIEEYWTCTLCGKLYRDEGGTTETTLAALVIPKGFAKLKGGTVKTYTVGSNSAFKSASYIPVTVNGFYMAMTETTYERWYEVYTWATTEASSKYTFANKGQEGSSGIKGVKPTVAKQEPVTYISWRDAVVWCNAASEKEGKTPVYYVKGTTVFTSDKVLRESEDKSVASGAGKADKAVINENANGYRLPTHAEWEYAARGGDPSSEAWSYLYAGTNNEPRDYVVANVSKTAAVGTKKANSAGLYDMTGNVWEWDQGIQYYSSGTVTLGLNGGAFGMNYNVVVVYNHIQESPFTMNGTVGFRVCFSSGSN